MKDLENYTEYEIFEWVCEAIGDYDACEGLVKYCGGGVELEKLVMAVVCKSGEALEGDMLAWLLEGNTAYELLDHYLRVGLVNWADVVAYAGEQGVL